MEMKIIRGGMQTTVQDLGRRGQRAAGVPLSGAMDSFALRVANSLVGNPEGCAVLEFALVGPEVEFEQDALVAVCGASFEGVQTWRPRKVAAGGRINLGACVQGCRGYLAVAGGIDVPPLLGSRSTYLPGGWGGFEGRALRDGDRVRLGMPAGLNPHFGDKPPTWQIDSRLLPGYSTSPVIRAVGGTAPKKIADEFFAGAFKVTAQFDRMGVRLSGAMFTIPLESTMLSTAVAPGTVQVPPDGQPVILMADAQTIGGYTQVAHVIAVDLPLVAQLRAGDRVSFTEVTVPEAQRLALVRAHSIAILREGIAQKLSATNTSKG